MNEGGKKKKVIEQEEVKFCWRASDLVSQEVGTFLKLKNGESLKGRQNPSVSSARTRALGSVTMMLSTKLDTAPPPGVVR